MSSSSATDVEEWGKLTPRSRPTNNLFEREYSPERPMPTPSPPPQNRPSINPEDRRETDTPTNTAPAPHPKTVQNTAPRPLINPTNQPTFASKYSGVANLLANLNRPEEQTPRDRLYAQLPAGERPAYYDTNIPQATPPSTRGGKTGGRRGRGGARNLKATIDPVTGEATPTAAPARGRSVNRGGRPRGSRAGATTNRGGRPRGSKAGVSSASSRRTSGAAKRKRKNESEDESSGGDTSGSEAINLPMLSSSGRRITQASSFVPGVVIDLEDEVASKPASAKGKGRASLSGNGGVSGGLVSSMAGSSRKRPKKVLSQSAVCKNCGRGHSPQSNQIVFCDGCNTPWHQYCHDRPITPTVILHEEKEWHCADCAVTASIEKATEGRVSATVLAQSSGVERTLKWQRDYLLGQSKEVLVNLLLSFKEARDEDIPLFEYNASFAMLNPVPVLEGTAEEGARTVVPEEDEIYEEPLPYPKMGNGLVVPKAVEDWELMVDESVSTFSHSWQADGVWHGTLATQIPAMGMQGGGFAISVGA